MDAPRPEKIEPIVYLLLFGVLFFALLLVAISKWSPNDGQTFQTIASLVAGFSGALFMRVNPPSAKPPLPPGSTQVKETTSVTQVANPAAEEPKS